MSTIILVTGATDGIGKQTALALVKTGAMVIVHGRNAKKVDAVATEIRRESGSPRVEKAVFDLASFAAIRSGAADLAKRFPKIDVLLNNAGVYMNEWQLTADGLETTFAVNHLAPFLLTNLLLPQVKASGAGRIVTVSSMVHMRGRLDFEDLNSKRGYSAYGAYASSKLANVLFTFELADRLRGESVTANCLHPGVVATKLLTDGFGMLGGSESLEEGAETSVYLATAPELKGVTGKYFSHKRESFAAALANDVATRRRLWSVSEQLCGLA